MAKNRQTSGARSISNATESSKKEPRRDSGTPWPVKIQALVDSLANRVSELEAQVGGRLETTEARLGALERRVEHDFGGSDSGHLGARVEELEKDVELLGLTSRLDQY